MKPPVPLQFAQPDIFAPLDAQLEIDLDALEFGVIGVDAEGLVRRYNKYESQLAGLSSARVLGTSLFTTVAPCMNNFLVAQRFEDAIAAQTSLDAMLDYVFTLRMRPAKVKLRLLVQPKAPLYYILVKRRTE
jgi:photoactive yellow protein